MRGAYVCSDRGVPVFGTKGCSLHVQEVLRALNERDVTMSLVAANIGGICPKDLATTQVTRIKHAR